MLANSQKPARVYESRLNCSLTVLSSGQAGGEGEGGAARKSRCLHFANRLANFTLDNVLHYHKIIVVVVAVFFFFLFLLILWEIKNSIIYTDDQFIPYTLHNH